MRRIIIIYILYQNSFYLYIKIRDSYENYYESLTKCMTTDFYLRKIFKLYITTIKH